MIKVPVNEFKGYIDETFDESDGKLIYEFYRDILQLGKRNIHEKAKQGFQRNKYESSTSRRLKHIQFLVNDYGTQAIISAYRIFNDKLQHGEIEEPTINYFAGFVKNEAIRLEKTADFTKNSTAPITKLDSVKGEIFIPVPYQFVEDMHKNDSILNWDFKCSCGQILPGWTDKCDKCGTTLDWKKVDISKLN